MGNSLTVVCDLDGVLFRGPQPVPGAGVALQRLSAMGCQLLYATNNSTRTAAEVAATITERTGHRVSPGDVVTSGMATAHHLRGSVTTAFVIGGAGLPPTLQHAGIEVVEGDAVSVDAVVVGLDRDLSYGKLATACLAVRAGARLVATNADPTFPSPRGLVPGAGSLVAAVERATGREAEVCGKPHEPMAHLVTELAEHDQIVMIGDRIETDIRFGIANGWRTVLVLTGVATAAEGAASGADDVLVSIAELPGLLTG
jgi:HAD superfamily hydrolase (TIGR01450 family)